MKSTCNTQPLNASMSTLSKHILVSVTVTLLRSTYSFKWHLFKDDFYWFLYSHYDKSCKNLSIFILREFKTLKSKLKVKWNLDHSKLFYKIFGNIFTTISDGCLISMETFPGLKLLPPSKWEAGDV